ncbi:MAG: hypothetical protein OEV81_14250 [Betaproteobacteria bacterium]|nr:hypothetical protein [Betaproteobacteria bacterium]MDH5221492.1 hypothetical protein [Betaproteobacteria bacterium]
MAAQSEASKPGGMKVEQGSPPAPKADAKPMKTAAVAGKRTVVHMNDDARHCLEQPSIAEIIKCAEPYRY